MKLFSTSSFEIPTILIITTSRADVKIVLVFFCATLLKKEVIIDFFSVLIMVGLLGLVGWKVTVISSNFIALMLILTMAMNIHISVRYLQFKKENPNISNSEAILWTSKRMFWPILYTVLTTICAFLSLIFSDIKPIIDFGWMMTVGLLVSLFITFSSYKIR